MMAAGSGRHHRVRARSLCWALMAMSRSLRGGVGDIFNVHARDLFCPRRCSSA